jgi:hypothetical protein
MLKSVSLITAMIFELAAATAQAETTVAHSKGAPQKFTAEISAVDGKVLLNRGEGFVVATAKTRLSVGDQVMVGEQSSAELTYGTAGCTVTVSAGSLLRIAAEPPCKKGESLAMASQTLITPTAFENVFNGSENSRLLALAPIVVVGGLVLFIASTYKEPDPASRP